MTPEVPKNPNRLRRLSVWGVILFFVVGVWWFLTTNRFDGLWTAWMPANTPKPIPEAERVRVSADTTSLLQGYHGTALPDTNGAHTPVTASPTSDALAPLLNGLKRLSEAQEQTNAHLQLLIKAHEKPAAPPVPTPPAKKALTPQEIRAAAKQAAQEEEDRQKKAQAWSSQSIAPDVPKDQPGQVKSLKTPYSLPPGYKIHWITEAKISNETPGPFLAYVSEPVFDAVNHRDVVIPQMAWAVMRVGGQVIAGDSRLPIEAKTLTFPRGQYLSFAHATVGDSFGTPGAADQIDRHTWRLIGSVILGSVLRMGTAVTSTLNSDLPEQLGGAMVGEAVTRGTQHTQSQFLRTDPTMVIRSGYLMTLYLEDELVLAQAYTE